VLAVDPRVDRVLDEVPGVAADVAGARVAVAAPVPGLVVWHLHPVGDHALDAVAPGRLLLVVRLERLRPAAGREVHVLEVLLAEVLLPDGRVVPGPIRLRDLVVQRAVEARRARYGRGRVLIRVVRVTLVAELGQHDEDLVGLLAAELDVLVDVALAPIAIPDLDDRARSALLRRRLALQDLGEGDLTRIAPLVFQRVGQLVGGRRGVNGW